MQPIEKWTCRYCGTENDATNSLPCCRHFEDRVEWTDRDDPRTIYHGQRDDQHCRIFRMHETRGAEEIPGGQDIVNHSPSGFNWGYNGSGPAQTALALLLRLCPINIAMAYYQHFKEDVVAHLAGDGWFLTGIEILYRVDAYQRERERRDAHDVLPRRPR